MAAVGFGQVVAWYVCTIVALCFLFLRLCVRWRRFGRLALDDCFLILAGACLIINLAIAHHMWNLGMATLATESRENFIGVVRLIIPASTLYVTSLWCIKVALVIFFKRIDAPGTKLQQGYNAMLGVLAVTWLIIFFDILFQCWPVERKWTLDPNRKCTKKAFEINYWMTILFNIFTDVTIISLPISMVLKLQMPLKQRLAVAGLFALGFMVVIASIIRAYYAKFNEQMLVGTVSRIEACVAMIAASLPAFRAMLLGQTSRGGASTSNGRHYEISSSRSRRSKNNQEGNETNAYAMRGQRTETDSEDDLFREGGTVNAPSVNNTSAGYIAEGGITVSKEYQVHQEDAEMGRVGTRY